MTISFLKLRQFSVNGQPPWAPDFTTLGSINPYSSQSLATYSEQQNPIFHNDIVNADSTIVVNSNKTKSAIDTKSSAAELVDSRRLIDPNRSSNAPSHVAFQHNRESFGQQQQQQYPQTACYQEESLLLACDGNDLAKTSKFQ